MIAFRNESRSAPREGFFQACRVTRRAIALNWTAWLLAGLIPAAPVSAGEEGIWKPLILGGESGIYLPDYSYAGYRWGESRYPSATHVLDIGEFRAAEDEDITLALGRAIAKSASLSGHVVIQFPPGRFEISDIIYIDQGSVTIRGSGSGQGGTEFFIRQPLKELKWPVEIEQLAVYLKEIDRAEFSPFSWTGGYFWVRHPEGAKFAYVTNAYNGFRGGRSFEVGESDRLQEGQTVRIRWFNKDGDDSSLLHHIFEMKGIEFGERLWENPAQPLVVQDVQIVRIEGSRVFTKEPLLHDVRELYGTDVGIGSYLEDVGFEEFRITFPETSYDGHHLEHGFNAFYINDVRHGWMRDVHIHNADSAILSDNSSAITIEDIKVTGRPNHYGVHLGNVHHVLVRNFKIQTDSLHSISFNTGSRASVFTGGRVYRPRLDQHRGINHQNLFDDLDVMEDRSVSELFKHGGARYWGPTHGAYNTFWNIRVTYTHPEILNGAVNRHRVRDGSNVRIVGLAANVPIELDYRPNPYIEGLNRPGIAISSLYHYQLERRLRGIAGSAESLVSKDYRIRSWNSSFELSQNGSRTVTDGF